jgi:hypothetical protein
MGHYPAWPGSQSYLRVACIFNHSTAGSGDFVSSTFTIHDFSNVVYHNGAGRTVTATASAIGPPSTITIADCRGIGTWVNRGITGNANIAARTFVTTVSAGCAVANPAPVVGTLTLNKPLLGAVAGTLTIENSNVRSVTDATLVAGPPDQVTSATANFTAADVGLSITGTNIANGYLGGTLALPTLPGTLPTTMDITGATITPGAGQTVTIGGTVETTTTRTINDGQFTATNQITSAANAARFQTSDVGLRVSGTGITQPCYILTRNSASLVTLTSACNDGSAGTTKAITIGEPSRTAPLSTDTVLNQGVQLPLNPALVAGSAPCTADQSAGFGIEGTWFNPGSFVGGAFATQPAGTKAIGEILFSTSVINYGAYVIEMPATTDPLIGGAHYNIVFPNVPTTLALCPSTATSPGLGFSIGLNATGVSTAAIPTGQGRPGTAQLRSTRATNAGSASTVFITDDVNGAGTLWTGPEFNRFCSIPVGPPVINFVCGPG